MPKPNNYIVKKEQSLEDVRKDTFLFHQQLFINRNNPESLIGYGLFDNDELIVKIYFQIKGASAVSLPQSPFGSFDCIENIDYKALQILIRYFCEDLNKEGVKTYKIISFPECYQPQVYNEIERALLLESFIKEEVNISQYCRTDVNFEANLQASQRRYLNYANKSNFTFRSLENKEFNKAYELIKTSRLAKGYPVTMSFKELLNTTEKFNNAYYTFGLFDAAKMIAASVSIAVNKHILYDFYHGDDLNYRKHSPVVPLIAHLHNFAQQNHFQVLDLGLSTENGRLNRGLYDFKKNMGAIDSEKTTYTLVT